MTRAPDYLVKRYSSLLRKTLENAVSHVIGVQFPRIGGPRIRTLCARMILEVVYAHMRPTEHMRHGQVLWTGIAVDDPPRRYRRTEDTRLVPVALDLSIPDDIQARFVRKGARERLLIRAVRLCEQAYQQGALLSNADLSELLTTDDSAIAQVLVEHEKQTGRIVPRRATLHDMGTGLTHKRIICLKRYREGKSSDIIARDTYHSIDAVDRYLGFFDRVRHCREQGMSPEKMAYTLNCSIALVNEYLAIDDELEGRAS